MAKSVNPRCWKTRPIPKVPSWKWGAIREKLVTDPQTGCWMWQGTKLQNGYGIVNVGQENHFIHRVVWRYLKGEIPDGMLLCHSCDTPLCANPDHLFIGTHADNSADMVKKGRSWHPPYNPLSVRNQRIQRADPKLGKPAAKITEEQVVQMRIMYRTQGVSTIELAKMFGLSRSHTQKVLSGQLWKHVV